MKKLFILFVFTLLFSTMYSEEIQIIIEGEVYTRTLPTDLDESNNLVKELVEIVNESQETISKLKKQNEFYFNNQFVLLNRIQDLSDETDKEIKPILRKLNNINLITRTLGLYGLYTNNNSGMGGKLGLILNINKFFVTVSGGLYYNQYNSLIPLGYTFDIGIGWWLF